MKYKLIIGLILLMTSCKQSKIAYIENALVFDAFDATIEMKKANEDILKERKKSIDEQQNEIFKMESILRNNKITKDEMSEIMPIYRQSKLEFDSSIISLNSLIEELEYSTIDKSWNEINVHLKAYGKLHNYDLIHGVSGNGNLMYAKEEKNITKEVIEYINQRYNGEYE